MNHTDSHGAGTHRRHVTGADALDDLTTDHQTAPATNRWDFRSIDMNGLIHEQLARQRHREAYLEAREVRLWRAVRARNRALRAAEVAVRAAERVGADTGYGRAAVARRAAVVVHR